MACLQPYDQRGEEGQRRLGAASLAVTGTEGVHTLWPTYEEEQRRVWHQAASLAVTGHRVRACNPMASVAKKNSSVSGTERAHGMGVAGGTPSARHKRSSRTERAAKCDAG